MDVQVIEAGNRSTVTSKARRFAPQGVIVLGQLLERMEFADNAFVALDWSNELGLNPSGDTKPIVYVRVAKRTFFDKKPVITTEVRLDVEDLFGTDSMTAENLLMVVQQIADKMQLEIFRRKSDDG